MNTRNKALDRRYLYTMAFLRKVCPPPAKVLDLGIANPFSEIMAKAGYEVMNTHGEDLDVEYSGISEIDADLVTAFEILEHLVSPFNVLREINAKKLIVTVPLRLWFAKAYRNPADPWDRHYHEFEDWQLDWLLEKSGWTVLDREKWTSPSSQFGIRPFLRNITPRYYAVYARRTEDL